MKLKDKKIILASASPRRKELLAACGFEFTIDSNTSFVEEYAPNTPVYQIPELMSEGKSLGFHRELENDEILITSDTMVICEGRAMGKPSCREEAIEMLRFLSGKAHSVISSVTIRDKHNCRTASDKAIVHFKNLNDSEIEYYVDNYKPYDKAGAYAIQEWIGYIGITGIEGSFYTIMGLPTHLIYSSLARLLDTTPRTEVGL